MARKLEKKSIAKQPTAAKKRVVAMTATTTLTNEPPVAPPLQLDALASLKHVLRGDDADTARDAAVAMGATGDAAAVDALIEVLWNPSGYYHAVVRAAAASALGKLRDARSVDALLHAVRDPMAESSADAIRALALLGDPRAVDAIIEVVRNRDGYFLPFVRRAAVQSLSHLGGSRAYDQLRCVANNQWEDPLVREAAQEAIRENAF